MKNNEHHLKVKNKKFIVFIFNTNFKIKNINILNKSLNKLLIRYESTMIVYSAAEGSGLLIAHFSGAMAFHIIAAVIVASTLKCIINLI